MADKEALKKAFIGSSALREYQYENRGSILDLSEANLSGCDLRWTNFAGANLRGADFSGAFLTGAYFGPSEFRRKGQNDYETYINANLKNVNFEGAVLLASAFNFAELDNASFKNAYMGLTNFRGINFSNVSFQESQLLKTAFIDCDFSNSNDIDSIIHLGPSSIDFDTLNKSNGISTQFLKQIGLSEQIIEYSPDLLDAGNPINFYSCFISHSSSDEKFCNLLYHTLVKEKIRSWYAPEDMEAGKKVYYQIGKAINSYDKLIIVLSESSLASSWVKNEIKLTRAREKFTGKQLLFPISIVPFTTLQNWKLIDEETGEDIASEIRSYYIPDFSNWENQNDFLISIGKLIKALRKND